MRLLAFAFTIVFVWTGPKYQKEVSVDFRRFFESGPRSWLPASRAADGNRVYLEMREEAIFIFIFKQ